MSMKVRELLLHQDNECSCGCGHDHEEHEHHHHHDDECGCGHDHDHEEHEHHHHHHDDECSCGCGHDHDHEEHGHHHHDDECGCGCGHDHDHEEHEHHHHDIPKAHGKRVYILENLGCANCAAKMESRINELPGVAEATITYATKQLRITAEDYDALLPQIQKICSSIESEVKVVLKDQPAGGIRTKTYIIEGLDCANCAAKLERRINEMDEVDEAVLTFATKQLRISAQNPDRILPKIREVCVAMEPEVTIHEKERTRSEATKEKESGMSEETQTALSIGIGAVLFIVMEVLEHIGYTSPLMLAAYVVAYAVLGWKVVFTALRNLTKGQIFDENFLMSVATLGDLPSNLTRKQSVLCCSIVSVNILKKRQ